MGHANVLANTIYLNRTRLLNADTKKNGKCSANTIKTQYFAPKRSIRQAYHQDISLTLLYQINIEKRNVKGLKQLYPSRYMY